MLHLFSNLKKFNHKIALIDKNKKSYSYKEVIKKSNFICSNVENKSVILMIASNTIPSIIGYIGFIREKNIVILLDKSFKQEYAEETIKKYKPNYIFYPDGYIKNKNYNKILSFKNYSLIKTNFKKIKKLNKKNLLLLSTSGTTQSPKFVRLSNINLKVNTNSIINYLKINSKHTTITTMPMGYSYGLSIINTHLESGAKIIVNEKTIFEKGFWKNIINYKVTSFGGVPQIFEQLKKLKFESLNLPNLKYLTQAGGKLEENLVSYYKNICAKKSIKFFIMYGQTEASPRMSYLEWKKFSTKSASIGKPLNGSKFEIINNKKKRVKKPFEIGELKYFGKNVSLGYAKDIIDLYKDDQNLGELLTGDLGYFDDEGYFYITGRKNRITKVFGLRINLDDIEKKLKKYKINVKCVPDNKYLKIQVSKKINIRQIKKIIFESYSINQDYVLIAKVKKFRNFNNFKKIKNIN